MNQFISFFNLLIKYAFISLYKNEFLYNVNESIYFFF